MKKTPVLVAAFLIALGGTVHAQTTAAKDPIVQLHAEEKVVNKAYADKKDALDAPRDAQVKAAGDKAAKEATAKGQDALVARREAESKVKAATKADYDAKLKVLDQERDASLAALRKKYPAPAGAPSAAATPK
jgi:hypothetical protein